MAASLRLIDEESRRSWQVWPTAEVIPAGAVRELGRYLFELSLEGDAQAADLMIDGVSLEGLRSRTATLARWRWEPGFHAGTVEAEVRVPQIGRRRFEIVTDPDLRKLSREHFDSMVREILEDSQALFSLSSFRRTVAHGSGNRPPAIARLEFLRSRIEALDKVLTGIAQQPRRRLSSEDVISPHHCAIHATGPEIIRSMRSGKVLRESPPGGRLPTPLRGCLPAHIRTRRKLNTTDLPEHRQIGACLRSWATWLNAAGAQLARRQTEDRDLQQNVAAWVTRCGQLARRLHQLAANDTFSHGEPLAPGLTITAIFRNDPRYQDFYRLWQDMNRGIAAIFGDFLDMPLARTWELYELWCFIRLLRAAVERFGAKGFDPSTLFKLDGAGGLTISASSVVVPVGNGWELCFQRRYREFWQEADGRGSFSRTMTPDIVATRQETDANRSLMIVLDAKYRINEGLNDAISSAHTYRDALVRESETGAIKGIVSAAYLLTPHVPALRAADGYRGEPMPGRLFRPDYRSTFKFGAVMLRPGLSLTELGDVLERLIADAAS